MADFNVGRVDRVCALFAPDLRANFRGQPERGYDGLCDLLKGSMADKGRTFSYSLDVKEILVTSRCEADLVAPSRLEMPIALASRRARRRVEKNASQRRVGTVIKPAVDAIRTKLDTLATA
jgi:hypothetical protein